MFSRSRHRGMVIDAGLNARRPSEDPGLSASHASGSYDSYVGGGLLRPGTRSAPPTSMMSAGIDDSVAVRQSQGRLSVDTADGRLRLQRQDQTCEWLQDDQLQRQDRWHGGAHSNLNTTTRSSSFRATPRRDADHKLHVDDATNNLVSTMTPTDRSVYPRDNVDHIQQSPRTGEMNSADFDDQCHVDPEPRDDVRVRDPGADKPTDPGRPAVGATIIRMEGLLQLANALSNGTIYDLLRPPLPQNWGFAT